MTASYQGFKNFVSKHWLFYLIGSFGLLLINFCDAVAPKIIQWLIDLLVTQDSSQVPVFFRAETVAGSLSFLSFTLLLNFIVAFIGGAVWRQGLMRMTYVVGKETRINLWDKLKEYDYSFFINRFKVGDLLNRLSQDYNFTRFMFGFNVALTIDTIIFTTLALVFMLLIDVQLTLACLLCFFIVPPFISYLAKKEHHLHLIAQRELSGLADLISQAVATVKLQRSAGSEAFWQHKLNASAQGYADKSFAVQKVSWHIFPFGILPVLCSYAILCSWGLHKTTTAQLSVGELLALASYVLLFQGHIFQIRECISLWQRGLASYKRILEVSTPEIKENIPTQGVDFKKAPLEMKSFSFSYNNYSVIKSLTLRLPAGQWLGITGALGSGKTTILRCISGLLPVEKNHIFVYGTDINYVPEPTRAEIISYVPQKGFLFSTTIRENLCLDHQKNDDSLWQVLEVVQLREFVSNLPQQLDTKIGEWGVDLSGGQKQRLAIGRAILKKPNLLLLDDCFSAIDSITEQEIMQKVRDFLTDTTVVWASHRSPALRSCTEVIILEDKK